MAQAILGAGALGSLAASVHTIQFAPLVSWLVDQPFSAATWEGVKGYFGGYYAVPSFVENVKWAWAQNEAALIGSSIGALAVGALPAIAAANLNPFRLHDLSHGDATWATNRTIRAMEKRKQVGIRNAKYLTLGEWDNKKPLRLMETLSVLLLAPPGTGKTAGFVVPSIIETDDSSFIINDPKPELFDLTSGWRSQVGHVFKIDWSATDKVDPDNLDDHEKTVFYPRFNVLSPDLLPPAGTAERDTYLDAVANVMIPAGNGGKDDYFKNKGRASLVGFLHYACSKVNDCENWDGLPSEWQGEEACIPMIIDMVSEGLFLSGQENDRKKAKAAEEGGFYNGDALQDWLKGVVEECRENGYNPRAATEIQQLVPMAPNERSGILGTMDEAFGPFKNAAVRERTRSSDFVPSDLRGIIDPADGEIKPCTLYVCVNQAEAAAFSTITALLYEVLSREFLAYGPKETNRNKVTLGPYPVCFMLDEFAKLPKMESVMTGPDLGRGKKTYYCLVAQSDSQIGKIYSKEDQQIIYATTAVKIILPQNDKDTIKLVQEMVGPTTLKRESASRTSGGDFKEWGKRNISNNMEKVDFIRPGDISGMKQGKQLLLAQGFMARPLIVDSVMYYEKPYILDKVLNPYTGEGPRPAPPLPDHIREKRIREWKRKKAREDARTAARDAASAAAPDKKLEPV